MSSLAGFTLFPFHVDKGAVPLDTSEQAAALSFFHASEPSDLLVLVHGWNNDLDEAQELYRKLLANLAREPLLQSIELPVLAVYWPSKRFADPTLIAGGAASFGHDVPESVLERRLDDLADVLQGADADRVRRARDLVIDLEDLPSARDQFVESLRPLLPSTQADDAVEADPPPSKLHSAPGRDVLNRLSLPLVDPTQSTVAPGEGGATSLGDRGGPDTSMGEAASLGDFFGGIRAGALKLANLTTYYTMKRRAGLVGRQALAPLLDQISRDRPGIRIHLVGHSFGGRLVTAAAAQVEVPVQSLSLLQAAFSHHGLAQAYDGERDGAFRSVLSGCKVSGPVLVTHTINDRAVGYAYPVASLLAGQTGAGFGDAADPYGGIGRNGAQSTPEAVDLVLENATHDYAFEPGVVYNLLADGRIADHGDVHNAHVAHAVAHAISST